MGNYKKVFALLFVALIGLNGVVSAEPQIGAKMPEFQLRATDNNFYGIKEGQNKVSVLFFMGWW